MVPLDTFLDRANAMHLTFREYWPAGMQGLGLGFESIRLSTQDQIALGSHTPLFRYFANLDQSVAFSGEFQADLNTHLNDEPKFVRLGCCSFKLPGGLPLPVRDPSQAIAEITKPNDRVADLLFHITQEKLECELFISEWHTIPEWSEFRLFIAKGELVGASQYHHQSTYGEIERHIAAIHEALGVFMQKFLPVLHLETVVADVFFEARPDGRLEARLIELNPFVRETDPCLFSWQGGGDFDKKIRFHKGA